MTEKYPAWRNAVDIILSRFDAEGYGTAFSSEEIDTMLKVEKPTTGGFNAVQEYQLEKMAQLDQLKNALLEDSNICLDTVRGNGYKIVHPDDQIKKVAERYRVQSRKKINKAINILTCVDNENLSVEAKQRQVEMLCKAAFIRQAMGKRKVFRLDGGDVKQIE